MLGSADTTPQARRRKPLTRSEALKEVEDAAKAAEAAKARLGSAVASAWTDHQIPLTDIALAANYNRERIRSVIHQYRRAK